MKSETVSVRLPADLLAEAARVAPTRLRRSGTQIVQAGLRLFIIQRKRELFAKGMRRMECDPQAMTVDRKLRKEFQVCDNDGLKGV